jgi:hypothetical protein
VDKLGCGVYRGRVVWVEEEEVRRRRGAPAAQNLTTVKRGLEGGAGGVGGAAISRAKTYRLIP